MILTTINNGVVNNITARLEKLIEDESHKDELHKQELQALRDTTIHNHTFILLVVFVMFIFYFRYSIKL